MSEILSGTAGRVETALVTEPAPEFATADQATVDQVQDASATTSAHGPNVNRTKRPKRSSVQTPGRERSVGALLWYRFVQYLCATLTIVILRWRATGQHNMPGSGGVLLVCNHLSFVDVFLLGMPLRRPLNYVARSTLFLPGLGALIWSVGGFPIQREGMGASGMKETLKRLRAGGIVTLFPEGTRSPNGELGPLKSGIAVLVARAGVPIVPAGLAGTFEVWPRSRLIPGLHPIRIHYGSPIFPEELAGMDTRAITELIHHRMEESCAEAKRGLIRDMS